MHTFPGSQRILAVILQLAFNEAGGGLDRDKEKAH